MTKSKSRYSSSKGCKIKFDLKAAREDELAIAMENVDQENCGSRRAFTRGKLVHDANGNEIPSWL